MPPVRGTGSDEAPRRREAAPETPTQDRTPRGQSGGVPPQQPPPNDPGSRATPGPDDDGDDSGQEVSPDSLRWLPPELPTASFMAGPPGMFSVRGPDGYSTVIGAAGDDATLLDRDGNAISIHEAIVASLGLADRHKPFYLVVDGAVEGGPASLAQRWATITGREVLVQEPVIARGPNGQRIIRGDGPIRRFVPRRAEQTPALANAEMRDGEIVTVDADGTARAVRPESLLGEVLGWGEEGVVFRLAGRWAAKVFFDDVDAPALLARGKRVLERRREEGFPVQAYYGPPRRLQSGLVAQYLDLWEGTDKDVLVFAESDETAHGRLAGGARFALDHSRTTSFNERTIEDLDKIRELIELRRPFHNDPEFNDPELGYDADGRVYLCDPVVDYEATDLPPREPDMLEGQILQVIAQLREIASVNLVAKRLGSPERARAPQGPHPERLAEIERLLADPASVDRTPPGRRMAAYQAVRSGHPTTGDWRILVQAAVDDARPFADDSARARVAALSFASYAGNAAENVATACVDSNALFGLPVSHQFAIVRVGEQRYLIDPSFAGLAIAARNADGSAEAPWASDAEAARIALVLARDGFVRLDEATERHYAQMIDAAAQTPVLIDVADALRAVTSMLGDSNEAISTGGMRDAVTIGRWLPSGAFGWDGEKGAVAAVAQDARRRIVEVAIAGDEHDEVGTLTSLSLSLAALSARVVHEPRSDVVAVRARIAPATRATPQSLEDARALHAHLAAHPNLVWGVPRGATACAEIAVHEARGRGIEPNGKVWVFDPDGVRIRVAMTVCVRDEDGTLQVLAIDPGRFPSGPVSIERWSAVAGGRATVLETPLGVSPVSGDEGGGYEPGRVLKAGFAAYDHALQVMQGLRGGVGTDFDPLNPARPSEIDALASWFDPNRSLVNPTIRDPLGEPTLDAFDPARRMFDGQWTIAPGWPELTTPSASAEAAIFSAPVEGPHAPLVEYAREYLQTQQRYNGARPDERLIDFDRERTRREYGTAEIAYREWISENRAGWAPYWDIDPQALAATGGSLTVFGDATAEPLRGAAGCVRFVAHYLSTSDIRRVGMELGRPPDGYFPAALLDSRRSVLCDTEEGPWEFKYPSRSVRTPGKDLLPVHIEKAVAMSEALYGVAQYCEEPAGVVVQFEGQPPISMLLRRVPTASRGFRSGDHALAAHTVFDPEFAETELGQRLFERCGTQQAWIDNEFAPRVAQLLWDIQTETFHHAELHSQNLIVIVDEVGRIVELKIKDLEGLRFDARARDAVGHGPQSPAIAGTIDPDSPNNLFRGDGAENELLRVVRYYGMFFGELGQLDASVRGPSRDDAFAQRVVQELVELAREWLDVEALTDLPEYPRVFADDASLDYARCIAELRELLVTVYRDRPDAVLVEARDAQGEQDPDDDPDDPPSGAGSSGGNTPPLPKAPSGGAAQRRDDTQARGSRPSGGTKRLPPSEGERSPGNPGVPGNRGGKVEPRLSERTAGPGGPASPGTPELPVPPRSSTSEPAVAPKPIGERDSAEEPDPPRPTATDIAGYYLDRLARVLDELASVMDATPDNSHNAPVFYPVSRPKRGVAPDHVKESAYPRPVELTANRGTKAVGDMTTRRYEADARQIELNEQRKRLLRRALLLLQSSSSAAVPAMRSAAELSVARDRESSLRPIGDEITAIEAARRDDALALIEALRELDRGATPDVDKLKGGLRGLRERVTDTLRRITAGFGTTGFGLETVIRRARGNAGYALVLAAFHQNLEMAIAALDRARGAPIESGERLPAAEARLRDLDLDFSHFQRYLAERERAGQAGMSANDIAAWRARIASLRAEVARAYRLTGIGALAPQGSLLRFSFDLRQLSRLVRGHLPGALVDIPGYERAADWLRQWWDAVNPPVVAKVPPSAPQKVLFERAAGIAAETRYDGTARETSYRLWGLVQLLGGLQPTENPMATFSDHSIAGRVRTARLHAESFDDTPPGNLTQLEHLEGFIIQAVTQTRKSLPVWRKMLIATAARKTTASEEYGVDKDGNPDANEHIARALRATDEVAARLLGDKQGSGPPEWYEIDFDAVETLLRNIVVDVRRYSDSVLGVMPPTATDERAHYADVVALVERTIQTGNLEE
ncbi:hypothetical protein LJR230_003914 [Trinickia sp. LjRoot230]|uniref:hypothetical protein n=1 Tax=Trinickia sp. LjRoot230 TaxID=3342288 RepID=UPI003ECFD5FC